jgi:hypothetical protein
VANSTDELARALEIVRARDPVPATSDASALAARLDQRLQGWASALSARLGKRTARMPS